ncbi:MAG: IS66 family insertion sequence element accessory protein TnpB [Leptospiraceae bacterium]|nr:IS66 family insertion sequence element accessory protein TnpB [Leptospiraceae bacterium]
MILSNPFRFKVYLYPKIIDMRKSWNGLITLVQYGMNLDPFQQSLFVFCGRSQRLIKIIYWDGNGFCMWMKRLEKGNFPFSPNENLEISRKELIWLLSGIGSRKKHKAINFSK